jgi:dTMP kinase
MSKGQFIVLEGIDGAGTTTQGKNLAAWWTRSGRGEVHLTAEPSSLPTGRRIREILSGSERSDLGWKELALLFAADRLDHVETEIKPLLEKGTMVISDRYLLSSLVYQGLHMETSWVESINRFAPSPDLMLWIDVPVDEAMRRTAKRGEQIEVYEKRQFQEAIYQRYVDLHARQEAVRIDGSGSPDDVLGRIISAVEERA